MKPHLITGATGQLGQALTRAVLERDAGQGVILGARRPSSLATPLATRYVDYDDPATMRQAFTGVSSLLLVSSNAPNDIRLRQHRDAIDAAAQVGVERILYTSIVGASAPGDNPFIEVHHATEAHLQGSKIPYVILRNGVYLDSLPSLLAGYAETGVVAHPTGDSPVGWITRTDIAAFTVDVLLDSRVADRTLTVVPPETASMPAIIAAVAEHTGCSIEYQQPGDSAYIERLVGFGLPTELASTFAQVCRAVREGCFDLSNGSFEARMGRRPMSARELIAAAFPRAG